jgi:polar amino acid transport system substrate-binding protein
MIVMRRLMAAAAATIVVSGGLAACGSSSSHVAAATCSKAGIQHLLYHKGVLTVATDNPVYTPWFVNNTPSNGKGYESAVAYALAKQLGFSHSQVVWVHEPFNSVYAPGPKAFDFDINEVSFTTARAQAVTFSNSYYPVQQAIVALKTDAIVAKHSPAQLKTYQFGDQIGTTGLTYINSMIKPSKTPLVFNTLNDAASALEVHHIDALVTDTPTAQYMASAQIKHAVLVAQFPSTGEHYGLVFHKGNPLATCVNKAIATLTANGTLTALQHKYLGIYLQFPTIKP